MTPQKLRIKIVKLEALATDHSQPIDARRLAEMQADEAERELRQLKAAEPPQHRGHRHQPSPKS